VAKFGGIMFSSASETDQKVFPNAPFFKGRRAKARYAPENIPALLRKFQKEYRQQEFYVADPETNKQIDKILDMCEEIREVIGKEDAKKVRYYSREIIKNHWYLEARLLEEMMRLLLRGISDGKVQDRTYLFDEEFCMKTTREI
jgi:N-methylhydantoinase B/oxoprolinase/acetone carboxylase alpha subunit